LYGHFFKGSPQQVFLQTTVAVSASCAKILEYQLNGSGEICSRKQKHRYKKQNGRIRCRLNTSSAI